MLEEYKTKRDFSATPEPKGRVSRRKAGDSYVIQKHAARRLHYDLRLEMAGVLRSWAVTKGPSLVAGEKRLAVHVEDHPLDYGGFEGVIPPGSYGTGEVILWDRGRWAPIGDAAKGHAKGHLEFELFGEKLRGRWHLVRMQGRRGETRENWLLIKADDAEARDAKAPDILEEAPASVLSGRRVEELKDEAPTSPKPARRRKAAAAKTPVDEEKPEVSIPKAAKAEDLPDFIPPVLATSATKAPTGERWLHEIKYDGYRLQARIKKGKVSLRTRSGLDWTAKFGKTLPKALGALSAKTALIDGELVVESGSGASDFSALRADLTEGREDRFRYYAFDLLHLDGANLRDLPLTTRKDLLEQLLTEAAEPLRYSSHFEESGETVLRHACRLSLEGVVSKLATAPYRSGRGKAWVKSKCSARQEFVIGGYTPSTSQKDAVGSLLLGVYEEGALRHVGRVGTGFTAAVARDLQKRLSALETKDAPFAKSLTAEQARGARYVRPELVAEVEFRAWTADAHLRHASFHGLREDKPATEIVEEAAPRTKGKGPAAAAPARRNLRLTHPDRIYWPEEGITKEGLADYYVEVWRRIAPFVVNRPLALLRCPTGITGQQFFQKNVWSGMNPKIVTLKDPAEAGSQLIGIRDLDGLLGLVQSAALELHPWQCSVEDWERPDQIVMDLDPGEGVTWPRIIEAAEELRARLGEAGLAAFVKTSGGKGLHVVAPLKPHADWKAVKAFTRGMAQAMASDAPDLYVATVTKSKRKGKILVDYLRNQRGATAVAAFSTRARPGANVSTPLSWEELGETSGPDAFRLSTLPIRLANLREDPWEGFRKAAVALKKAEKA